MDQKFELNHCYNVDCMDAMRLFPDGYFDLAVVDPPYFSGPERRGFYGSRVSNWIFKNYAKPGQKVLDTHLGSGSSRIAAYEAGIDFIGFEIDSSYFSMEEERFTEHTNQMSLFHIGENNDKRRTGIDQTGNNEHCQNDDSLLQLC